MTFSTIFFWKLSMAPLPIVSPRSAASLQYCAKLHAIAVLTSILVRISHMNVATYETAMEISGYIPSDMWFADGNTILIVGRAVFKVHRGQLERHSEVFRDMFALPQPTCQDMIDGCLSVQLYDSPSEVLLLLRALYDGLYFKKARAQDFEAIAAVLRLSTKYLIEHLRMHCISHLEFDWPSTLQGWDYRERLSTDASGRYNPRESYAHPIFVIKLARELGLDNLLPSAFYDLCRYGPSKIATGILPSPKSQPLFGISICSDDAVQEAENPITLCRDDLLAIFVGREAGQHYIVSFIEEQLTQRAIASDCSNRADDAGRICRESFYFIQLNILRSVGGIAAGRDGDSLFTLAQAVEMLSRTDFSDGVNQCGLKICNACRAGFVVSVKKCREKVWNQIPVWFGLSTCAVEM